MADQLTLASGRVIDGVGWGIGLDAYGQLVLGCDTQFEYEFTENKLTQAEREELAGIMIERWRAFANG